MLPSLSYQFMILDKACTKVSRKILLPCRFKCSVLRFIWVGFILFACMVYQRKILFFALSSQMCVYFFCFVLKVVILRYYIRYSNIMFFTLESYGNNFIDFAINSGERSESRSFLPTCSTK